MSALSAGGGLGVLLSLRKGLRYEVDIMRIAEIFLDILVPVIQMLGNRISTKSDKRIH
jgi:ABC-type methionine transport system permease subunit